MVSAILPTLTDQDYHPTGGSALQVLDFYRVGTVAGVAFPVLVVFGNTPDGTFGTTPTKPASLDPGDGVAYFAREAGFSIAYATYTVTDDAIPGDGLFGGAEHAEKDGQRVVQYLRQNAATLGIDATRIFVHGEGAAGTALAFTAFGPDAANPGSPNLEERQSTRVAGAALVDFVANWDTVLDTVAAEHFTITPSATLGSIASGTLDGASLLSYGLPSLNTATPFYLANTATAASVDYVSPYPSNSEGLTSAWHSLAAGAVLAAETPAFHDGVDKRTISRDGSSGTPSTYAITAQVLDFILFEAGMVSAGEVVLRMFERRLEEILLANGYKTDVARVFRYGDPDGDGSAFPSIMVHTIDDSYAEDGVHDRETVVLRIGVNLNLEGAQDHNRRTSSFIADVRKRFKDDLQFGSQVDEIKMTRSRRWLDRTEAGEMCGAACEITIQYLERFFDPFVNAPDLDGAGPY